MISKFLYYLKGLGKNESTTTPVKYASEGEQITCFNEHDITQLTEDVYVNNHVYSSSFDPQLDFIVPGDLIKELRLCPTCFAPYMYRNRFHFKGEEGFRTTKNT